MMRSVLVPVAAALVAAGCVGLGGNGGAASTNRYVLPNGAVRGSFNLYDSGGLPPTVTAGQVSCDWAPDNRHIVLHIRFRNAGAKRVRLVWYAAGLVVDGVDSSAIFEQREITDVAANSAVVVDARVDRPRRVEPGAILTSCEPRSQR